MGTEIIPYLICCLSAAGILIVVLRMIVTRRWLAACMALALSLAAYLPFYFVVGWGIFPILDAELALALAIGIPALVYSRRWPLLVICLSVALVPVMVGMLPASWLPPVADLDGPVLRILIGPMFVWAVAMLAAPVCIALASVFFVGAFIERRAYRTAFCNPC